MLLHADEMRRRKLPLDPVKSAAVAGLHYVLDQTPGIIRVRRGRGFAYLTPDKTLVRDRSELERIRKLVIPPAWSRVWICPSPAGHLQAIGYDALGRKQYRYHPAYRSLRNHTKFSRISQFVAALPAIRAQLQKHLALEGMPREKVLAAAVRLLETTGIRVGNEASASQNRTFGLTTLRNKHVSVEGHTLRFRFTGKSGVKQTMEITDRRLARIIRDCQDLPGQQLFEYVDDAGETHRVGSTEVNNYIREISGQDLTAKDFRTWAGTVECAVALRDIGPFSSETEAKRNIVTAIKTAAERLGNRAATCRAYYVHPAVLDAYLAGDLVKLMGASNGESVPDSIAAHEQAVLAIIRRYERKPDEVLSELLPAA